MPTFPVKVDLRESNTPEPTGGYARVSKNAGIYILGQIVTWMATLIHMVVSPNFFGSTKIGEWQIAATFIGTASTFVALCLENFLTVESARKSKDEAARLINAAIGLRLVMVPLVVVIPLSIMHFKHENSETFALGVIISLGACLSLINGPMLAALSGWEEAKKCTIISIISSSAAIVTIPVYRVGYIPTVIASQLVASVVPFFLLFAWVNHTIGIFPTFDPKLWKRVILGGAPFLLNSVVLVIYSACSTLILQHFTSLEEVGNYGTASKLIGATMFFPAALCAALLPTAARMADANDEKSFDRMQIRVFSATMIAGLGVSTFMFMLGGQITHMIYRDRFPTVPAMMTWSAFGILPIYITTILYTFLVAKRKNASWSVFLVGTVILNYTLCYLLIPYTVRTMHNGGVGAIVSFGTAEFTTSIFAMFLLKIKVLNLNSILQLAKAVFASALMALSIWLFRDSFILIPIALGGAVFILSIWFLRAIEPEDQEKILGIFTRKFAPIIKFISRR